MGEEGGGEVNVFDGGEMGVVMVIERVGGGQN